MSNKISSVPSCADPFDSSSISLTEALAKIQQRIHPVDACEVLPIRDCLSRVSSDAVKSPHNVPPLPNSAMDGYAVSIECLEQGTITDFEDIGTAFAGAPFNDSCGPGQCVRIMTGALIPGGTDAVIMQEQAEISATGKVRIDADHRVGENIRQAGEDVQQGEIVIEAGAVGKQVQMICNRRRTGKHELCQAQFCADVNRRRIHLTPDRIQGLQPVKQRLALCCANTTRQGLV